MMIRDNSKCKVNIIPQEHTRDLIILLFGKRNIDYTFIYCQCKPARNERLKIKSTRTTISSCKNRKCICNFSHNFVVLNLLPSIIDGKISKFFLGVFTLIIMSV